MLQSDLQVSSEELVMRTRPICFHSFHRSSNSFWGFFILPHEEPPLVTSLCETCDGLLVFCFNQLRHFFAEKSAVFEWG